MTRRWLPVAAASAGLLAWSNVVVPSLAASPAVRTAVNAAAAVALVAGARSAGMRLRELGVTRSTWHAGARWGSAGLAVASTGYLLALAVPAGRAALAGSAGSMAGGELAVRALVLIPLGTVLVEELAFRGVLLALARRQLPDRAAGVLTAAVFGLWHVRGALRTGSSVAGTVVLTACAGLVFAWLRLHTGSLLAPVGLHLGTNSVGLLAAAAAAR